MKKVLINWQNDLFDHGVYAFTFTVRGADDADTATSAQVIGLTALKFGFRPSHVFNALVCENFPADSARRLVSELSAIGYEISHTGAPPAFLAA